MAVTAGCGTGAVSKPVAVHSAVAGGSDTRDALWIVDTAGRLRAYNGESAAPVADVDLGRSSADWGLVASGRTVWAYDSDGRLLRVDTVTATVTARLRLPKTDPVAVPDLDRSGEVLWVNRPDGLWRVPVDGEPAKVALPVGFTIFGRGTDESSLWASASDGRLVRVAAGDGTVTLVGRNPVLRDAAALRPDTARQFSPAGGLLVARPGQLVVLDPNTAATVAGVALPDDNSVISMAVADGQVCVVTGEHAALIRQQQRGQNGITISVREAIPVRDAGWTAAPVMAFGALWIADELGGRLIRIPLSGGPAAMVGLPLTGVANAVDLVLSAYPGQRGIWLVDSAHGSGIMFVRPEGSQVVRLVAQLANLTRSAVVAALPA